MDRSRWANLYGEATDFVPLLWHRRSLTDHNSSTQFQTVLFFYFPYERDTSLKFPDCYKNQFVSILKRRCVDRIISKKPSTLLQKYIFYIITSLLKNLYVKDTYIYAYKICSLVLNWIFCRIWYLCIIYVYFIEKHNKCRIFLTLDIVVDGCRWYVNAIDVACLLMIIPQLLDLSTTVSKLLIYFNINHVNDAPARQPSTSPSSPSTSHLLYSAPPHCHCCDS